MSRRLILTVAAIIGDGRKTAPGDDVTDVPRGIRESLVSVGWARWVSGEPKPKLKPEPEPDPPVNDPPVNFQTDAPGTLQRLGIADRVMAMLLTAGVDTLEKLRRRLDDGTITQISGIGDATAEDLAEAVARAGD